jgi:hypothetical protein
MIFPNEIIENILSFSHPVDIASFGLVSRDLYFFANKIQFSPDNTNIVKSNHLLSLWYHLLKWNNHNKNLFDSLSNFKSFSPYHGILKIYCNSHHIYLEIFDHAKVFKRHVNHEINRIDFFTVNDTMYIVLSLFMHVNWKIDIIRIIHSNAVPVDKRISYFSKKIPFTDIRDLKMNLLSFHHRKNLSSFFVTSPQSIVVHKNFIIYCANLNHGLKYYQIDTLAGSSSEIAHNEKVTIHSHVTTKSCETVTNLASTVHPIVNTIARQPKTIILFSPLNGHPYRICDIKSVKHPKIWMFFLNDPENYVLDQSGEFYKVVKSCET